jgi:hypothetical protein
VAGGLRKLVSPKVIAAASLAASVQSKARKKLVKGVFSRIVSLWPWTANRVPSDR